MNEEITAISLAYDAMHFRLRDASDDEDREIYTVVCEAMEAQMPRWAVHDDPLPYLQEQLTFQSQYHWQHPSDDAEDMLLYYLGFTHALTAATPLRKLTADEDRQLSDFLHELCGLDNDA